MFQNIQRNADWAERFVGTTRDIYHKTLQELALSNPNIYCLDSDQGGLEENFAKILPRQYINIGIAEANMMTVAAALAFTGKIPFVNTMASFATARACEQIKIDIAYNNLPVKIVATYGGVSGGHFGPTHHALEDIAIMRALPNMTVLVPADTVETMYAVKAALQHPGPVYLRLGRKATPLVYQSDYDFSIGHATLLHPGSDILLVACGPYPVIVALEAAEQLSHRGIFARVINMHTVKPLDRFALLSAANEVQGVITIEEHSIIGGLGSAVAEFLAEQALVPMRSIGIPDVFCDQVGSQLELLTAYGVSTQCVLHEAFTLLKKNMHSTSLTQVK